jgi:hypothetical protein
MRERLSTQVDPSLSWEITEEASAGLDFELLDRRLKDRLMFMIKQQQMSF